MEFRTKDFSVKDIYAAYDRIKNFVYQTPLEQSMFLSNEKTNYYFKLESAQTVKSFKMRGALSVITALSEGEKKKGVATISSGNHGSSVAYAAKLLGISNAVIIVPETAPQSKVNIIKFYSGKVLQMGANYDEAHKLGMEYIEKNNLTYIDAYYEDHRLYGGQGTIGLEILKQNPNIDTIVVPVGGGGLITGIGFAAKAINPNVRVIGVQTEACPAFIKAFEDNVFYKEYPVTGDTLCDATVGGVGKLSYERMREVVSDIIEIKEETIRKALKLMILDEKFIVEGASAMTVAAVMDYAERIGGKNVALVLSGGSIDANVIKEII